jgi:hypothetical protein
VFAKGLVLGILKGFFYVLGVRLLNTNLVIVLFSLCGTGEVLIVGSW